MLIHQLHQLRAGKALDEEGDLASEEGDDDQRVWIENHTWRTNFPPPDNFLGDEDGEYGDDDYNRQCTPDEWAVLDRRFPDAFADEQADSREADEAERDTWFAELAAEMTAVEADTWEREEIEDEESEASPEPVRPEPVEGLPFACPAEQIAQPFDKLRANGVGRMAAQPLEGTNQTAPSLRALPPDTS